MEFSKGYQLMERQFCNCRERGSPPSLNHHDKCRFHLITKDSQIIYNDFKAIQDYGNETHAELKFLKTEVAEVKAEMTEIKAMLSDFLTPFRASRESG